MRSAPCWCSDRDRQGRAQRTGGYARAVLEGCPWLPAEEESRLDDVALRENFVSRLYTYQRWLSLCAAGLTAQGLLDFHMRHNYLLMAHSPHACRRLGRLLSRLQHVDLRVLARDYLAGLMMALRQGSGTQRQIRVLRHMLECLKRRIAATDMDKLRVVLDGYSRGEVPLAVPVLSLRRHACCCLDEYPGMQCYLWPYPDELELRSHL